MVEEYIQVYETVLEKTKCEQNRSWGYYKILADDDTCKTKETVVFPGKFLSLQRHWRCSKHWYILDGRAEITLDDKTIVLVPGQSVDIPKGALHRIANPGSENVRFIEVQTGDYLGEDDIECFEDDFRRA
jgi:mannose-6-phosphate isomerase-like protein (cupin superfamily)